MSSAADGGGFAAGAVLRIARLDPGRTALVVPQGSVSYAQLAQGIVSALAHLKRIGVRAGDWVAIDVGDECSHLTVSLALMACGCNQVSLGAHETQAARRELLSRLPPCRILGSSDFPVCEEQEPSVAGSLIDSGVEPSEDSPHAGGALFTSSGTTGKPKLVYFDRAALEASFARYVDRQGTVVVQTISVQHGIGRKRAWRTLIAGGTVVTASAVQSSGVLECCARHRADRLYISAYALADVLRAETGCVGARSSGKLQLYAAGSKLPVDLVEEAEDRLGAEVLVVYGATETGTICLGTSEDLRRDPDNVGKPVRGIGLRIVDRDGVDLPAGAPGTVAVRAPGCISRYLDGDGADKFRDGWFFPGDLGCLQQDGSLSLSGREDDQMILNTINIFPAEIERVARTHPAVFDCAAFAIRSRLHGDIPALACVVAKDAVPDDILTFCRLHLGVRAPRRVFLRKSLPRDAQGKIPRRILADEYAGPHRP